MKKQMTTSRADVSMREWCKRQDTLSEWLRRWTRNPLGSARRGSNPLGVALLYAMIACTEHWTAVAPAAMAIPYAHAFNQ